MYKPYTHTFNEFELSKIKCGINDVVRTLESLSTNSTSDMDEIEYYHLIGAINVNALALEQIASIIPDI